MAERLPNLQPLTLRQSTGAAGPRQLRSPDALIVVMPESPDDAEWRAAPYGSELKKRWTKRGKAHAASPLVAEIDGQRVIAGFAKTTQTPFEQLTLARKLVQRAMEDDPAKLGIHAGMLGVAGPAMSEALVAAALAAAFPLPKITRKRNPGPRLSLVQVLGLDGRINLKRLEAEAAGNNLARWLTGLPGNYLTPAIYRKLVEPLAKREGWSAQFLNEATLKRMGAGAFLAVSAASDSRDAGILHLKYRPKKRSKKPLVALAGKGICYDTGGTNLKDAKGMFGMQGDMQGSAVALGTLLALSQLEADFPVDCYLALAQNHIGPKGFKQNDVVTASDGTTIEIVHTDAEGRMVLSDTLAIASKTKPAFMMDYATLTGACVYSLGTAYSGAFSNRLEMMDPVIRAGRESGERVWPFPNDGDYDEQLKSEVADIKQCLIPGEADHILASRLLNHFVAKSIPWVHVDLSSSERKGGLGHVSTEVTGFGVRFSLNMLLDQKVGQGK